MVGGVIGACVSVTLILSLILFFLIRRSRKDSVIPEEEIELVEVLAEGNFGQVWRGLWKETTQVAVKVLKMDVETSKSASSLSSPSSQSLEQFKKEAQFYMKLPPHPNIVQLLGVCLPSKSSKPSPASPASSSSENDERTKKAQVMIVLEYLSNGNLPRWLKTNLVNGTLDLTGPWSPSSLASPSSSLSSSSLLLFHVEIAKGVAAGMHHLHRHGIIHRDLAARNVLVQVELTSSPNGERVEGERGVQKRVIPKLGDFGLSVSVNGNKMALPVRWCPPEVLQNATKSSTHSDIWSFGVFLCELLTNCQVIPFPDMNNRQVMSFVLKGGTPIVGLTGERGVLTDMHPRLRSLMNFCFLWEPDERPSFAKVFKLLEDLENEIRQGREHQQVEPREEGEGEKSNPWAVSVDKNQYVIASLSGSPDQNPEYDRGTDNETNYHFIPPSK